MDLEDRLSDPMLRAAAATRTLDKSLNDLDGSTVRTDRDIDKLGAASGSLSKMAVQSRNLNREVDRTSGRLRLMADAAMLLGPALVPIGAVALPALTGLAAQAGAAALAGGTMVVAFQGVGTALEAVNKAALEPTAENLAAARIAMQQLGPEAQNLVRQVQEMRPAFQALRNAAAAGLFPGLTSALDDMERVFPNLERILFRVGDAAGGLGEDLGEALSGARGREFLSFIEAEVPGALTDLGHIVGNLAAGMGELWMAFTPLNNDFSGWLLDASRGFDDWAQGLSQTQGFQDFVSYIRDNGPRVADAMGSIGNALLQIVQAAAPLGGPVLEALTAVADVIAAVAGSDAGPAIMAAVTALTLLSRGQKAFAGIAATGWGQTISGAQGAVAAYDAARGAAIRTGAAIGGLALAATDVDDKMQIANTAMYALYGTMVLPGWGTAAGAIIGAFMDIAGANDVVMDSIDSLRANIDALGDGPISGAQLEDLKVQAQEAEAALDGFRTKVAGGGALGGVGVAGAKNLFEGMFGTSDVEEAEAALASVQDELQDLRQNRGIGGALEDMFLSAASAAERFRAAVAAANRVLEGRAAVVDYEQAVDDLSKSIRQNGRTLDVNTQKGRDNRTALDAVAASAVNMAKDMNATNGTRVLTQARKDIIDAAMKMGKSRAEAAALADRLLGLNSINAEPSVTLEASSFFATAARVGSELGSLAGRAVTTYVNVVRRNMQGNADGGTIYGTVPGQRHPYGDKVLAYLAPGEEVISNRFGQADRHRELLKAINSNAYAGGGTVVDAINRASSHWSPSVSVGGPSVSVGGPRIQVFIDGNEVRHIARTEANSVVNAESRHSSILAGNR